MNLICDIKRSLKFMNYLFQIKIDSHNFGVYTAHHLESRKKLTLSELSSMPPSQICFYFSTTLRQQSRRFVLSIAVFSKLLCKIYVHANLTGSGASVSHFIRAGYVNKKHTHYTKKRFDSLVVNCK